MTAFDAEVVVVGAGFAGLAAAQVLGRAQRDVVVLGSGPTRNAEAAHAHNILTRDGTPPGELLRLGRDEVAALPRVRLADAHVTAVEAVAEGRWRVVAADGTATTSPVVVLATGVRDTLPEVAGLRELWGRRAHSCPFCDGEPYAGRRLLVVAAAAQAAHAGPLLRGWTDRLTIVDPADVHALAEDGDDVVATLADGTVVRVDGVFVAATPVPRLDCVAGLPLPHRGPYLAVDNDGRTPLPGLWAVGDCAWRDGEGTPGGQVIGAMASASRAAAAIVLDRLGVHRPDPPPAR